MITKLKPEQEQQIPAYIEKWVSIASRTMDHKKATNYTRKLYTAMGEPEPLIIFGFSPYNTALLCALFWNLVDNEKLDFSKAELYSHLDSQLCSQLGSQLRSQLYSQLYSHLGNQLRSHLGSQLCSQLYSQLYSQLDSQLRSHLSSQLRSQLGSQLRSQLDSQLKEINQTWYLGIWWLTWCGWYAYGKMIGVDFDNDKYDLFINFNSEVNFIIPYKGVAFISEKPVEINWSNGLLHKDGGAAVQYSDGYGIYCLNGIKVPEYLAVTPEGDLDIEFFKKEENADIKTEFVRKFGVDRLLHLGKQVDDYTKYSEEWWSKSEYALYDMASIFEGLEHAYFLKMKNQTTEIIHVEPVHPDCNTLPKAVSDRLGGRNLKITNIK